MNFARLEFVGDLNLNMYQKVMVGIVWFSVMIVGNIMLYGLIQFERNGGDPLKRRMVDQVNNILAYNIQCDLVIFGQLVSPNYLQKIMKCK